MSEMVGVIPDDRCGLEVSLENIEVDDRWGLEQWRREDEAIYCYRSSWRDERCIWHANVDDKPIKDLESARAEDLERLDGAILRDADIKNEISLIQCGLTDADLRVADFTDANLRDATLTDAHLLAATLTGADLRRTDLKNADVRRAEFTDPDDPQARPANLEDSVIEGADLRGTDFSRARLFQTVLTDARINSRTEFDATTIYEQYPNMQGGSGKKRHPNRRQRGCIAGSNHSTRRTQCPKKLDSTTSASRKPNEHTIYDERKRT